MGYLRAVTTKLIMYISDTFGRRSRRRVTKATEEQGEGGDNKTNDTDNSSEIDYYSDILSYMF